MSLVLFVQLFEVLNINIVLIEVITWSNGDQIPISSDPEILLNTFRAERDSIITTPHDSAMLLTYVFLEEQKSSDS